MTILVDPPVWPAHGRLWSHLVSDTSLAELHGFAAGVGIPRQGFDRDHYDVPAEAYDDLVAAGARPVGSRELLARLHRSGLRRRRSLTTGRRKPGQLLLRPPRLRPGSVVAVVAPAGPPPADRLERGLAVLREWGLRLRMGSQLNGRHPALAHLAGSDAERAADLEAAWCAPEVAAIWPARGGYGSHRVVDLLDHTSMAAAGPRLLVGFSDVTALHELVNGRLGLVSVHGPVVTSLADAPAPALEHLRALLFEPDTVVDLFPGARLLPVVGGSASGVLVGGNLRVLTAGLGTRLSRPARGGIAVLEDVGEQPYQIDGMLTQLRRSGWFDGVRGVVTGAFTEAAGVAGRSRAASDAADPRGPDLAQAVEAVLRDRLGDLGVPVANGAPVGHQADNRPVPLGALVRLDADAGTLRLPAPALA